jgi:hypothetical protein
VSEYGGLAVCRLKSREVVCRELVVAVMLADGGWSERAYFALEINGRRSGPATQALSGTKAGDDVVKV